MTSNSSLFTNIDKYILINIYGEQTYTLSHRQRQIYLLRKSKMDKIVAVYAFIDFKDAETHIEHILSKFIKLQYKDFKLYICKKYLLECTESASQSSLKDLNLSLFERYQTKVLKPKPTPRRALPGHNKATMQLWHGTKRENLIKILKGGFKLPKDMSGMFGLGIYFADVPEKSLQYCDSTGVKVLLYCDVEVGNPLELTDAKRFYHCPINYDSVKGVKSQSGLKNNEYIIYDSLKIKISMIFIILP